MEWFYQKYNFWNDQKKLPLEEGNSLKMELNIKDIGK